MHPNKRKMLTVTIAGKKECKGISKLVEEGLSEEVAQQSKFGGWINVNQTKRKGRDLCGIFVMETHTLRKSKSYQANTHANFRLFWVYGVQWKGKEMCWVELELQ